MKCFEDGEWIFYVNEKSYNKKYDNDGYIQANFITYYKGCLVHREDGPALVSKFNSDDDIWFINGKYHREDGPAVSYSSKVTWWTDRGYYINNTHIIEPKDFPAALKAYRLQKIFDLIQLRKK